MGNSEVGSTAEIQSENGEKDRMDVHSVYGHKQVTVKPTDIFELEYTGTLMVSTKERITELTEKEEKLDAKVQELADEKESHKQNSLRWKKEKEALEGSLLEARKLAATREQKIRKLETENEDLKKRLSALEEAYRQVNAQLSKFTDNHSKKPPNRSIFTEKDYLKIQNWLTKALVNGEKMSVKTVYDKVVRIGNSMLQKGDKEGKKYAEVSYETVRAAVAKIKQNNPHLR